MQPLGESASTQVGIRPRPQQIPPDTPEYFDQLLIITIGPYDVYVTPSRSPIILSNRQGRGSLSWTPKMRQVAKVEPCP